MKKFLLSLAACAIALGANADKVAFVMADSEWTYTGDAKTVIVVPEGFYFTNYNDAATMPKKLITKSLACDFLNIEASGAFAAGKYGTFTTKSVDSKAYVIGGALRWYTNVGLTITPAAGITITGVKLRSQSLATDSKTGEYLTPPNNYVFPFTPNASDTKIDVTNVECPMEEATITGGDKTFYLKPTGQIRISWIEFEYTGTLGQPTMPVTNVTNPYLEADKEVTLTSTAGADIYYTLDGTEPTASSTKYTGAFKLTEDAIVRAIAVNGDKTSFPLYQHIMTVPAGLKIAKFNMSDWESLTKKDGSKLKKDDFIPTTEGAVWPCNAEVKLTPDYVFVDNGAELTFTEGKKGEDNYYVQLFRSWTFGNVVEMRPREDGDPIPAFVLNAPAGGKIKNIVVVGSSPTGLTPDKGTFTLLESDTARGMWVGEESSVSFTKSKYIDQIYVFYEGGAGVGEIVVDENAPVEYYNLQGVRVANPENGIFIKRQGNKVEKILVK